MKRDSLLNKTFVRYNAMYEHDLMLEH